jgi:phosphatidylethanolamine-binding protein (PEBP) family uncharacterized protein
MPKRTAGRGVGDNVSPALQWTGVPVESEQLVLFMDDIDVPLPKPLFHAIAVLEPTLPGLGDGEFVSATTGLRIIPTALGGTGYSGPRPVPGHGPHRYRFHLFALDWRIPDDATSTAHVLGATANHVLARGTLAGTYER